MKHNVYGKRLGRDKNQRNALFRGLIRSLILSGSIETTQAKAKAIKGEVDRLISQSRKNSNSGQKQVQSYVTQSELAQKLFKEIGPGYSQRTSGFTKMVRLGKRLGDGAMMVRISLAEADKVIKEKVPDGKGKSNRGNKKGGSLTKTG